MVLVQCAVGDVCGVGVLCVMCAIGVLGVIFVTCDVRYVSFHTHLFIQSAHMHTHTPVTGLLWETSSLHLNVVTITKTIFAARRINSRHV